mgnify:CR=1 FL=1
MSLNEGMLPRQPLDPTTYLEELEWRGRGVLGTPNLDRSKAFRYREDGPALQGALRERIAVGEKLSVLDIGVGNMEEPLSYLAHLYVEAAQQGRSLADVVDVELVEVRPREQIAMDASLGINMFDQPIAPRDDVRDAFVQQGHEFVFRPEIVELLAQTMDNPDKAHFATPVETVMDSATTTYDVVACNNVLQHMGGVEGYATPLKDKGRPESDYQEYYRQVSRILESVKPGGTLIMHTDGINVTDTKGMLTEQILNKVKLFSEFEKSDRGIFRRLPI